MAEEIQLGSVRVPVLAQKHAYLAHRIGPAIQSAVERGEGLTPDGLMNWAADGAYDLLCALIPTLKSRMPRHVFAGYSSPEAHDAGDYDEAEDESPSIPEIREAFAVGLRVNGIDELMKLGKLVDPRLLRAELNSRIARSIDSQTSPSLSGGSDSTSSSTTVRTSDESAA